LSSDVALSAVGVFLALCSIPGLSYIRTECGWQGPSVWEAGTVSIGRGCQYGRQGLSVWEARLVSMGGGGLYLGIFRMWNQTGGVLCVGYIADL